MAEWLKRLGVKRNAKPSDERQTQATYDAARREVERRRERLERALNLEGLVKDMKEVRER